MIWSLNEQWGMSEECRLCGEEADLQNSHVIPRFVIRWIKNTSATSLLRGAEDPDTRIQDYHEKMLCEDCEQSFSDYERMFATNIFYPYLNDETAEFEYDEYLKKFIISISWRLIVSKLTDLNNLKKHHREALEDAEEIWRDILNDDLSLRSDPYSHHVIFLDDVVADDAPEDIPDKWEFYINRSTDGTPVINAVTAMYFKFPYILFFSCVQPPTTTELKDTQVEDSGEIGPPQEIGAKWGTFIRHRAERVTEHDISDSEQEKITEHMLENPQQALESNSMETYGKQLKRQIVNHDPLDYLNEECPVCYTEHQVVEFLPKRPLRQSEIERMDKKNKLVKAVYMRDELAVEGEPEDATPTFVLTTTDFTRIITLFNNVGWVVEREVENPEDADPKVIGKRAWEGTLEEYKNWVEKQSK